MKILKIIEGFFVVLDKTETKINKKTREETKKVIKYDLMVGFILRLLWNLIDDVSEKVHTVKIVRAVLNMWKLKWNF